MKELALQQPELIGREEELNRLKQLLDNAIAGNGSTIFIAGEAGIGKTRLVSELIKEAESKGTQILLGWCLAESLEPLMPVKSALREAGMLDLISDAPPPLVLSAYLMNDAGMLIAKAEREESGLDPDIFSSMLRAVDDFVQDSMSMMDEGAAGSLNSLGYGEYTILLQTSGTLSIAAVIKGVRSEFLITDMKKTLTEIGNKLDNWSGDIASTKEAQTKISWFIDSGKYDGKFLVDDPKLKQENLFDNVLLGIQRASEERPILLFLDDLQWADPTSLNLLHYLARNTRKNRVLLLGTYRPEDIVQGHDGRTHPLERTMQNMSREDLLEKMELKRLGSEEVEKVIVSALGKASFDPQFYDKIYKETEGTPFFILEVVKLLVEDGAISQNEEGVWELVTGLEKLDVPSKVYDVIKRRLDRLMEQQREILECASVVGEEFQSDVVGKALELNRLHLLKNLSEIEKTHRLIHSYQKKYVFDHAKVREVLYNGIMEELRQEYHRIIADTIAELHKDNLTEVVNELAHHYYEAGDIRAGEYLVMAGDQAGEKYANEEAIRAYSHALELIEDNEERIKVLEKLADLQALTGEFDKAIENYEKAKESAEDNETKARMLRKIGVVYEKKGEFEESLEIIAEAKKLIKEGTGEHGRILFTEGYSYLRKGDYDRALPLFQSALRTFEESGAEQKDIGNALRSIGIIYYYQGDYDPALDYFEKSLTVMEKIGEQAGIASALNNIGVVYKDKGELDRALEFHERSLKIHEKMGDKWGVAMSLGNIGNVYYARGELDRALEFHEKSLNIREKIGDRQGVALSLGNIGLVYYNKGELDRALEFHERSHKIREKIGDKQGIALSLISIGNVYHDRGELDRALEYYNYSLNIREKMGDKEGTALSLNNIGVVYYERGELANGLKYYEKSRDIFEKIGNKWGVALSLNNIGNVYANKGELDRALEFQERSLKIREKIGDKHGSAVSLSDIGEMYKDRGELDRALEYYERGLKISLEIEDKIMSIHNRCGLAEAKLGMGDVQAALENAEKAVETSVEIDARGEEGMGHRFLGMVFRERKEWDRAVEEFEKGRAILEEVGDRKELAKLFYEFGLLWKAKGEVEKAHEYLGKALAEFEDMGMKLWMEKCRKLL